MDEQKRVDPLQLTQRLTYGQQVLDHWSKPHMAEDDIIEYRKAMEPEIIKNINQTIENALKQPLYHNHDFYIVLLMKTERVGGVPRTMVLARRSCPTATYQQSVWKYHYQSGSLEFMWSIPDQVLYWHLIRNAHQYLGDPETAGLAKFCLLMESGELMQWIIKENGEKPDGIIQFKQPSASGSQIIT